MRSNYRLFTGLSLLVLAGACSSEDEGGDLFGDGSQGSSGNVTTADDSSTTSTSASGESSATSSDGGDDSGTTSGGDGDGDGDGASDDDSGTTGIRLDVPLDDTGMGTTSGGDGGMAMGCDKVDLLFVIDDSASMSEEQDRLTAAFPSFMQTINDELVVEKNLSYHVGVVSAEMGGTMTCTPIIPLCAEGLRARLQNTPDRLNCTDVPAGRWIENGPVNQVAAEFTCIASMTTGIGNTDTQEMPLEAARAAITDRISDSESYNAGFLRSDALLVVVLITDENDQSSINAPENWGLIPPLQSTPVQGFYDAIVAAKGNEPSRLATVVISGDRNADCNGGSNEGGADDAPRMHEWLDLVAPNSYWTNICGNDYVQPLQEALDVISASCETFVPPAG